MLTISELQHIAQERFKECEVLFGANRYDGAMYLCGYAVEVTLKARICQTLDWSGYPSTRKEFQNYQSFRTHNLEVLLTLSGIENKIKASFLSDWSVVADWNPEMRYRPIGHVSQADTKSMIDSARTLLGVL
ncbi:MAG: hypothetical protein ACPGWR_14035 [Ardenticatenaceae bacterium]